MCYVAESVAKVATHVNSITATTVSQIFKNVVADLAAASAEPNLRCFSTYEPDRCTETSCAKEKDNVGDCGDF